MPYSLPNFQRMMALIDEVFTSRNDPSQIQVDEMVMAKLEKIHPSTLSELSNSQGPYCWVLVIPTTNEIMTGFLAGKINESEILERTKPGQNYSCLYLCSATTLNEFRNTGATKKLCIDAITSICENHKIEALFVWPFSKEGKFLAQSIAKTCGLPLLLK